MFLLCELYNILQHENNLSPYMLFSFKLKLFLIRNFILHYSTEDILNSIIGGPTQNRVVKAS